MPAMTNDLEDSVKFFEKILKDNYGEERFTQALGIVQDYKGDRYLEGSKLIA